MNVDTGKIRVVDNPEVMTGNWTEVDPVAMTEKQKQERAVKLRDHRSKLGKQVTAERAKLRMYRKLRRAGKLR